MKKTIVKSALILLLTALIFTMTALSAVAAEPPEITHSECAWVYSLDNNMVLYEKEPTKKIYPASTVKLMTAALAIEYLGDRLTETVTVTSEQIKGVVGNNIGMTAGESFTVEELLYALIVSSANDAANVIAYKVAGGIPEFIKMMNEKAAELGMIDTVFTNPTGMHDPNMRTTVSDIGKMAVYAYRLNLFSEISGTSRYIMPRTNKSSERIILNKNHLVSTFVTREYYTPEVTGMNAGSTTEAGYTVTASSVHDGLTYIAIVMGADRDDATIYSFIEAKALLEWAYDAFDYAVVLEGSRIICEVPVELSAGVDHVTLLPEYGLELFLPSDINIEKDITYKWTLTSDKLTAPVREGQRVGTLEVSFRGEKLRDVPLVTKNSIAKSRSLEILTQLKETFLTPKFALIAAVAAILAVIYVLAVSVVRYRRRHRRRYFR